MRCYICKKEIVDNKCSCYNNNIQYDRKYIYYNNIKYKKIEFISKVCSFNTNGQKVTRNYMNFVDDKITLDIFKKNVKKYTFLGVYLPCAVFLLVFLVSISLYLLNKSKADFYEMNVLIFYLFLGILFLLLGIIKFVQIVRGDKCYIGKIKGQVGYRFIKKEEYIKICEELNG